MLIAVVLLVIVAGTAALLAVLGMGLSALARRMTRGDIEGSILALPGLRAVDGLELAGIVSASGEDAGSVVRALQRLAAGGRVEAVPGAGRQAWRLTASYRSLVELPDLEQRRR